MGGGRRCAGLGRREWARLIRTHTRLSHDGTRQRHVKVCKIRLFLAGACAVEPSDAGALSQLSRLSQLTTSSSRDYARVSAHLAMPSHLVPSIAVCHGYTPGSDAPALPANRITSRKATLAPRLFAPNPPIMDNRPL
jgi:hypothetical protein